MGPNALLGEEMLVCRLCINKLVNLDNLEVWLEEVE